MSSLPSASPSLASLWQTLAEANRTVAIETSRALRSRSAPPPRGPGSNYAKARAAYRAFWESPGAEEFARNAPPLAR